MIELLILFGVLVFGIVKVFVIPTLPPQTPEHIQKGQKLYRQLENIEKNARKKGKEDVALQAKKHYEEIKWGNGITEEAEAFQLKHWRDSV